MPECRFGPIWYLRSVKWDQIKPNVRKIYMNWINRLVSFCIHSGFCIVKLTYIDVSFTMIYNLKKKPMLLSCYYHKSRHYVTKCHVVDHESRGNILVQKRVRFFFLHPLNTAKQKNLCNATL